MSNKNRPNGVNLFGLFGVMGMTVRERVPLCDVTVGADAGSVPMAGGSDVLREARLQGTFQMIVTTTFSIEGRQIMEYKGVVRGIIVRSPTITQGFLGGMKSLLGGQIGAYTQMCEQARQQAYDLMIEHAEEMGANAIVGMHYGTGEVGAQGAATEVLCYGTAVVLR